MSTLVSARPTRTHFPTRTLAPGRSRVEGPDPDSGPGSSLEDPTRGPGPRRRESACYGFSTSSENGICCCRSGSCSSCSCVSGYDHFGDGRVFLGEDLPQVSPLKVPPERGLVAVTSY